MFHIKQLEASGSPTPFTTTVATTFTLQKELYFYIYGKWSIINLHIRLNFLVEPLDLFKIVLRVSLNPIYSSFVICTFAKPLRLRGADGTMPWSWRQSPCDASLFLSGACDLRHIVAHQFFIVSWLQRINILHASWSSHWVTFSRPQVITQGQWGSRGGFCRCRPLTSLRVLSGADAWSEGCRAEVANGAVPVRYVCPDASWYRLAAVLRRSVCKESRVGREVHRDAHVDQFIKVESDSFMKQFPPKSNVAQCQTCNGTCSSLFTAVSLSGRMSIIWTV